MSELLAKLYFCEWCSVPVEVGEDAISHRCDNCDNVIDRPIIARVTDEDHTRFMAALHGDI